MQGKKKMVRSGSRSCKRAPFPRIAMTLSMIRRRISKLPGKEGGTEENRSCAPPIKRKLPTKQGVTKISRGKPRGGLNYHTLLSDFCRTSIRILRDKASTGKCARIDASVKKSISRDLGCRDEEQHGF